MQLQLVSIEPDGVVRLRCEGAVATAGPDDLDGQGFAKALGQQWPRHRVALDLADVEFIDSAGIGWLLTTQKRFAEGGGAVVLHSLQPPVKKVIDLMRVGKALRLAADVEQASAALREKP